MKSCFFIGHREASDNLLPILQQTIEEHICTNHVTSFIVGYYGGFDRLAAQAVISLKKQYPQITLTLLLPYHPAERPIQTPPGFDNSYYPPNMEKVPRRLAIVRANQYIVDRSDYLIAYAWHPASNARNLVEYAEKRGISITNLSDSTGDGSVCQPILLITLKLIPVNRLNCLIETPFSLSFFRYLSRLAISNS